MTCGSRLLRSFLGEGPLQMSKSCNSKKHRPLWSLNLRTPSTTNVRPLRGDLCASVRPLGQGCHWARTQQLLGVSQHPSHLAVLRCTVSSCPFAPRCPQFLTQKDVKNCEDKIDSLVFSKANFHVLLYHVVSFCWERDTFQSSELAAGYNSRCL